jgi:hypothetical protein
VNTPELFILGAIVTAIVAVALGLVLYGAIMDGRAGPTTESLDDRGEPPAAADTADGTGHTLTDGSPALTR